jgi:hypothetical protein
VTGSAGAGVVPAGRGRVRRRLQLGTRVLRNVGEIGRQQDATSLRGDFFVSLGAPPSCPKKGRPEAAWQMQGRLVSILFRIPPIGRGLRQPDS